ncbi:hypothetical protein T01_8316 [Trichinella spiralis]|uniref:Uncharacterized protein n=1 Tax=Trichinella spiralis TaxID=6334 RepID=A0A0V1AYV1_TRISP|nr:hypothetical protein T01_8316 [Trichinella spiralis]
MTTIAVCKEMSNFDFTNTCSTTPNCKRIDSNDSIYDKSQHFEVISHNGNLKGKQKSTIEKIPAKRTTRLAFCHVSR